jgi:hypothetical protein
MSYRNSILLRVSATYSPKSDNRFSNNLLVLKNNARYICLRDLGDSLLFLTTGDRAKEIRVNKQSLAIE